ncbi:MAG: DNA-binding response regulator [Gammaproteobacteria bacterium]|nr:MAG: DNA-binding response regulator [Gammaproteobacteria bacterium]
MHRVLLIDDDGRLAELLTEYCSTFGMSVEPAFTSESGLERLAREDFDAIILDVMLPDRNGFDTCRLIRQQHRTPIIMLTARGELTDRVVGLELGADDYLPKPFEPRELVARLQSNIKRYREGTPTRAEQQDHGMEFGRLVIDDKCFEARCDGESLDLTTMEFRLLRLLASEPGTAFSRDDILGQLKGTDNEFLSRSVDILVSRLRAKLKPLAPIRTIHGAGYSFIASQCE